MRWPTILIAAALVATACSPQPGRPSSTAPPRSEQYFATAPTGAPVDQAAVCLDSSEPNITEQDYVDYWQTLFDDQRSTYPDQSFPSREQLAEQKRTEWRQGPNDDVPSGADAAFSRAVCGLPLNDGQLYSGVPFRTLRGHVAQYGRAACNSVLESGVREVWERLHPDSPADSPTPDGEAAQFELIAYAALQNVCPQLADYTGPPVIQDCGNLTPGPSADTGEGVFCRGDR
ncbi:hypothetical protein HQ325_16970 [Rhodococcus sp. BP-349]|uniref:hypothetical protein n=1 Tax=unclassified Rhodococcus (in: high G+C Gram-positive bacteria) TaxID=192944 RepID=UPI001C9AD8A9|nr:MULTISPECIES: hypothetical protein [unclassified Rhodococcus (in: high G+C Gram-positive bacteria)]MBY6540369.1 hypothetical protein [Rhodococcus sp. BP-363]MBY6545606.1 hypothetical protein [Rhodococcus sp. BP-369]MBY6564836.1 hypothetical protein [Rhodococcus sp. BP-370]MBY6578228.1 hypothetical protein [Rhodococcus sp. BP-364]MBY6587529.1 hypothetical protein [Rhodococcus sp. BP-358]